MLLEESLPLFGGGTQEGLAIVPFPLERNMIKDGHNTMKEIRFHFCLTPSGASNSNFMNETFHIPHLAWSIQ